MACKKGYSEEKSWDMAKKYGMLIMGENEMDEWMDHFPDCAQCSHMVMKYELKSMNPTSEDFTNSELDIFAKWEVNAYKMGIDDEEGKSNEKPEKRHEIDEGNHNDQTSIFYHPIEISNGEVYLKRRLNRMKNRLTKLVAKLRQLQVHDVEEEVLGSIERSVAR